MNKPRDYDNLAQVDRTHISLYTDPDVFHDEMERIFYRSWVYVAHESELPNPGDYKATFIGLVPVIVSRDMAGKVHVLVNRCMHRGATVCATEKGNTKTFLCPYHGWEYGVDGQLTAIAMPRGYNPGEIDRNALNLISAVRVGIYRGIIFASLLADPGISLDEKLSGVPRMLHVVPS